METLKLIPKLQKYMRRDLLRLYQMEQYAIWLSMGCDTNFEAQGSPFAKVCFRWGVIETVGSTCTMPTKSVWLADLKTQLFDMWKWWLAAEPILVSISLVIMLLKGYGSAQLWRITWSSSTNWPGFAAMAYLLPPTSSNNNIFAPHGWTVASGRSGLVRAAAPPSSTAGFLASVGYTWQVCRTGIGARYA